MAEKIVKARKTWKTGKPSERKPRIDMQYGFAYLPYRKQEYWDISQGYVAPEYHG